MNSKQNILLLMLVLCLAACTPKQVMYRQNLHYAYIPATTTAYDVLAEKDSLVIYLKFADVNLFKGVPRAQLKLPYTISLRYDRSEIIRRDSVRQFSRRLQLTDEYAYVQFKLPLAGITIPSVLQLHVPQHVADKDFIWLDIPLTKETLSKKVTVADAETGRPLFRPYVNTSESFTLISPVPGARIPLKQYEASFPAALPPFSLNQKNVSPTMRLIQAEEVTAGEIITLNNEGLYIIGSGDSGTTLISVENQFPELTTARELIEPLIYMTSSDERKKLYEAAEPKKALDRFWLDIANQDQTLARQLIKLYYQRVREANVFFSSHKAGWLTDRGMIYIIFGVPTAVNRRLDGEEWTYVRRIQGSPALKFNFVKKPNNFTQNHYELVRSMSYEFLWYSTVEKWRKGIILEE